MKQVLLSVLFLLFGLSVAKAQDEKAIVQKVNKNNAAVQSYVADLEIVLRRRAVAITSMGKSFYEKPRNYRLQTTNVRTQQQGSDIGSNKDQFWFWIRRIDANTLHFSSYENLYNTNLPDSLHPLWMMDILGVNQIDTKNATLRTEAGYVVVQQLTTSPQRQQVFKMTLIDPRRPAIVGLRLYSRNGDIITNCEIKSFYKTNSGAFLPQQSETRWYTEQIEIDTTVKNPKVNVKIDPKNFQIPRYNNLRAVDIGKERVDFRER